MIVYFAETYDRSYIAFVYREKDGWSVNYVSPKNPSVVIKK